MAADLDVINLFIIAGATLAIPIMAFAASFLFWPSTLIKVYYWYWRRTLGLQVRFADCSGYRFCYSYRGKLDNCGHSVVMERPSRTAKLILEFIIQQQDVRGGAKKSSSEGYMDLSSVKLLFS